MQIRIVPQNSMHMAAGKAPKIKSRAVQFSGNAFGASCKMTISKEGRRLSEQSKAQAQMQTTKSAQSLKVEKKMMRQLDQLEESDKQSDALKEEYAQLVKTDEYAELLKKIQKFAKSTNNSCMSQADRETIERRLQLLRGLSDQKQKQMEENQKQAAYAQEMAAQSSKKQDEIDQNNRDLLILLKSIEESEKAEEEAKEGGKAEEGGSGGAKTQNSAGDAIQDSAARFTASSIQRELGVVGMIDALNADGHSYLSRANEILGNANAEAANINALLADERFTLEEKKEAVFRLGGKLTGAYDDPATGKPKADAFKELEIMVDGNATDAEKEEAEAVFRMKMDKMGDLGIYRNRGVQMIKDSQEGKLLHIANNPLQGIEETKGIMIESAVDGAFNSAAQGKVDEASQELEDAVKELIDERNDITHTDEAEKEEEKKEVQELLGTETDENGQKQEIGIII